ncbi:MAG: enoyl-CoA hydratase/isomerase family protein [Desulfobacteraceae bacterium]|nr:enoyl-CoA hydratase/isomerase family protein [Desulfobacteraceae bacterium]
MKKKYQYLLYSNTDNVTTITLNDPDKLNALNLDMQRELLSALRYVRDDENTRVIIITGAGKKAFCVGADISVFEGISAIKGYQLMRDPGYEIHRLMEIMEKPIIAAVNGYCLAGGLEVALACDFIIASEEAVLGVPEINIGIIPGWGGCVRLARALGARRAKEWVMTGKRFPATEAKDLGLINRTMPGNVLMSEARKLALDLTAKSPNALKMAKMVINLSLESSDTDAALAIERGAISILMGTEDCAEGVAAFLEKRPPNFKGS